MDSIVNEDECEKNLFNVFNHLIHTNRNKNRQIRIAVEGNIGSGKSTILDIIDKAFVNNRKRFIEKQIKIYQEPVDKWRNFNGTNLLNLLYENPARWSFTVQSHIQLTMLEQHLQDMSNLSIVKVMERSLYSAKYCFSDNLYKIGILSKSEHDILNKWFEFILSSNDCELDLILYLRTDPEICMHRINSRARKEEISNITLDYLENVHNSHEQWLNSNEMNQISKKYCPKVLVIDANQSINDVCKGIVHETNVLLQ